MLLSLSLLLLLLLLLLCVEFGAPPLPTTTAYYHYPIPLTTLGMVWFGLTWLGSIWCGLHWPGLEIPHTQPLYNRGVPYSPMHALRKGRGGVLHREVPYSPIHALRKGREGRGIPEDWLRMWVICLITCGTIGWLYAPKGTPPTMMNKPTSMGGRLSG